MAEMRTMIDGLTNPSSTSIDNNVIPKKHRNSLDVSIMVESSSLLDFSFTDLDLGS